LQVQVTNEDFRFRTWVDSPGGGRPDMILSGWKQIAAYLGCGIRTAQRWEATGLPVHRPIPGRRSHVTVESEQLDFWVRDTELRRNGASDRLATVQRARELRKEIQQARQTLRLKMEALRKELAALRRHRRTH
jgi:hypothetical protein